MFKSFNAQSEMNDEFDCVKTDYVHFDDKKGQKTIPRKRRNGKQGKWKETNEDRKTTSQQSGEIMDCEQEGRKKRKGRREGKGGIGG